ncbi:peptidylprolyl isomerase [soil metagenome]
MNLAKLLGWMLLVSSMSSCAAARSAHDVSDASALRPHASDWERILAAEDARARTPAQLQVLRDALTHPAPPLRRMAVRALGRLERAELASDIAPLLHDPDPTVRAHAANALAQASRSGEVDRALIESAVAVETNGMTSGVMAESLGRIGHRTVDEAGRTVALLTPRLVDGRDEAERLGAIRGLYFLARQQGMGAAFDSEVVGVLRSAVTSVPPISPQPALPNTRRAGGTAAAESEDSPAVRLRTLAMATLAVVGVDEALVTAALGDGAWIVRREAVVAGATVPDTAALHRILTVALADRAGQVRYEALRAYGRRLAADYGCGPVRGSVGDADAHVRLLAVELLGTCPGITASDILLLDSLAESINDVRWHRGARALVSLAKVDPAGGRTRLRSSGLPADPFARVHTARAFAILEDTAALRRLAADDDVNVRTAAVQALAALAHRDGDDVYLAQLSSDDHQLLQVAAAALDGSPDPAAPEALLTALDRVSRARAETSRDARRALLQRAAQLGNASLEPRLRPYLQDFDPELAELAADVIGGWTGSRPQAVPRPLQTLVPPTFAEAALLSESTVEIQMMDGGSVLMRLLSFEAPTNAARFARLARTGYFDGLTFHRVVPNFVVQGGSPHANEYAGDGPFSRDELGLAGNWYGTVGLSTRGRDTGDAQLFINLVHNVRLDHEYTIFAVVTEGMDVVNQLQEGARIRSVRIRPTDR